MLSGKEIVDIWNQGESLRRKNNELKSYYDGKWSISELNQPRVDGRAKTNLRVNFVKYITRVHTGYVLSEPIQYISNDPEDVSIEAFEAFTKDQDLAEKNSAHYSNALLYGYSLEVHSFPDDEIKIDVHSPHNWVVIKDEDGKPVLALYHTKLPKFTYFQGELLKEDLELYYLYDSLAVHRYRVPTKGHDRKPVLDETFEHPYQRLPISFFFLNADWETFFDKSLLTLIDNYAISMGSLSDDLKYQTDSLLLMKGVNWESLLEKGEDGLTVLEKLKAVGFLPIDKDSDASYLTRTTDIAKFSENLSMSRDGIHLEACIPDVQKTMAHSNPNLSSTALKVLYSTLIHASGEMIHHFESGLRDRVNLYNRIMNITGRAPALENFDIVFDFANPQNMLEFIQNAAPLMDVLPRKRAYQILPFVKDPDRTYREWIEENGQEAYDTHTSTSDNSPSSIE